MKLRLAFLTSVHARTDTRVYHKMAKGMAAAGCQVHLVVADGLGNTNSAGVTILDVGRAGNRILRMLLSPLRILRVAIAIPADVYHLHDPELLPIGVVLSFTGRIVVFDAHEDVPAQLLDKPYLPRAVAELVSRSYAAMEWLLLPRLAGAIAATGTIAMRLVSRARVVETINNYPLTAELWDPQREPRQRNTVCYVGAMSEVRGLRQLFEAMALVQSDATLVLCGKATPPSLLDALLERWRRLRVIHLGQVSRVDLRRHLSRAAAGLVTFLAAPNHVNAQPNKLFEYMSAGIPVIASDFPRWRELVAGVGCGILVDPADPQAVADAIDFLVTHPDEARVMGERGRLAVNERLNWKSEEKKLLGFYESLRRGVGR